MENKIKTLYCIKRSTSIHISTLKPVLIPLIAVWSFQVLCLLFDFHHPSPATCQQSTRCEPFNANRNSFDNPNTKKSSNSTRTIKNGWFLQEVAKPKRGSALTHRNVSRDETAAKPQPLFEVRYFLLFLLQSNVQVQDLLSSSAFGSMHLS